MAARLRTGLRRHPKKKIKGKGAGEVVNNGGEGGREGEGKGFLPFEVSKEGGAGQKPSLKGKAWGEKKGPLFPLSIVREAAILESEG